jgi:hypothetical protein
MCLSKCNLRRYNVVPAMGLPAEGLARVPVDLHDIKFDGTVRVLMAELTREDPGYGAIVISFPEPPAISLDIRLGGGLEVGLYKLNPVGPKLGGDRASVFNPWGKSKKQMWYPGFKSLLFPQMGQLGPLRRGDARALAA